MFSITYLFEKKKKGPRPELRDGTLTLASVISPEWWFAWFTFLFVKLAGTLCYPSQQKLPSPPVPW